MFILFLGLTLYFASNKERKEERKKLCLVNILLRFSVLILFFFVSLIEEKRSLCLTFSEFFISHKLKTLRQTTAAKQFYLARIQVFIGSVSYRWLYWGSFLMKSNFNWRLLWTILIIFFVVTIKIIYLWVQYNRCCILSWFSSHFIDSTGAKCAWNNLPH